MHFERISIGCGEPDLHCGIQIALVNMAVQDSNVEASFLAAPVLSSSRLSMLGNLLNGIAKHRTSTGRRIDLVVFPEVSVPHSWESMIVAWARRHNIGVIAGLEHRTGSDGTAHNEVLAALPYRSSPSSHSCVPIRRLKKFYSPAEVFELENHFLKIPKSDHVEFQLIQWRGVSFAIYNCYELTSLEHRAIFKGKVDFLVCTEFNRDTNYFSNIVESASRDIHCYVVQVNDSQCGDSRIIAPSATNAMNPVRIKGGDNLTFLTAFLDLEALRSHQRRGYGLQRESIAFKSTPPGFDTADVLKRIKLGVSSD